MSVTCSFTTTGTPSASGFTASVTGATATSGSVTNDTDVCGQPASGGISVDPVASDALQVLRRAVSLVDDGGCPACLCDVTGDGQVMATDSLNVLRRVVGIYDDDDLTCWDCGGSVSVSDITDGIWPLPGVTCTLVP